jgi:hypothetical protein
MNNLKGGKAVVQKGMELQKRYERMEIKLRYNDDNTTSIIVNNVGVAFISETTKRFIVSEYWAKKAGIEEVQLRGHFINIYS